MPTHEHLTCLRRSCQPDAPRPAAVSAGVLAPYLVPRLISDNKVGAVALVAAHCGMAALALAYAFALAFAPTPEKALPQALLAAIALAAAVTAALDLERAVDVVQRERPAVAAGLLWLTAAGAAVAVCGMQEVLLFRGPSAPAAAMQSWKWGMVLCFAVAAAASVTSVGVSSKCAAPSRSATRRCCGPACSCAVKWARGCPLHDQPGVCAHPWPYRVDSRSALVPAVAGATVVPAEVVTGSPAAAGRL